METVFSRGNSYRLALLKRQRSVISLDLQKTIHQHSQYSGNCQIDFSLVHRVPSFNSTLINSCFQITLGMLKSALQGSLCNASKTSVA